MKPKGNNYYPTTKVVVRLFYILSITLIILYFIVFIRIQNGTYYQQQQKVQKVQLPNIILKEEELQQKQQQLPSKDRRPTIVRRNGQQQQEQIISIERSDEWWVIPSNNYQIDPKDLWEQQKDTTKTKTTRRVPLWMKQYFRWHKEMRYKYFSNNNNNRNRTNNHTQLVSMKNDDDWTELVPVNILHVTCLSKYTKKCGGIADRLLSLPFILLIASQSKRYIIIEWDKPNTLENFLLPPVGGIDWRIPNLTINTTTENSNTSFAKYLRKNGYRVGTESDIVTSSMNEQLHVVQIKFQSHDHGSNYYNTFVQSQHSGTTTSLEQPMNFDEIFGTVWNYFFTPVERIQYKLQHSMYQNQLYPKQYRGVHLRALYTQQVPTNEMIYKWTINSINCAYSMKPKVLPNGTTTTIVSISPVVETTPPQVLYFASDSSYAIERALQYGNTPKAAPFANSVVRVVVANISTTLSSTTTNSNPLHLDKAKNWKNRNVEEYDPLFIDLYMLGMSDCITYGLGGYGKLASLLSIHPNNQRTDLADEIDAGWSSSSSSSTSSICSMIHMTAMSLTECPWIPVVSHTTGTSMTTSTTDKDSTSTVQRATFRTKQEITAIFREIFPKAMP